MDRLDININDKLKEQLVNSTDFSSIKKILLLMKESGIDIQQYIDTTVYRKLIIENKDYKGFNEIKRLLDNKNIKQTKSINNNIVHDYENLNFLEIQLKIVQKKGNNIKNIPSPSFDVQIEAVRQNGMAIRFIKNPSIEVQLEAINQNPNAIKYIHNPSKEIQIEAVQGRWELIKHITEPTNEAQNIAVEKNWRALEFIKNPSMEMVEKAITKNGVAIQYINNPDEDLLLEAIEKDAFIIEHLSNIPVALQIEAVRNSGLVIQFINSPSEVVQLEAVKRTPAAIQFIRNPSISVQLEAVRNSEYSIQFIKNPTETVQIESVRANPGSIVYINNPSKNVLDEFNKHNKLEEDKESAEQSKGINEEKSNSMFMLRVKDTDYTHLIKRKYDKIFADIMMDEYYLKIIDKYEPIDEIINYICDTIHVRDIYIASGYVYKSGLELIKPSLEISKKNNGEIKIIIGSLQKYRNAVSYNTSMLYGMDKDTAQYINDLTQEYRIKISTFEEKFYHGKYYLLKGKDKTCLILGSSNVSSSGFKLNRELNILQVFNNDSLKSDKFLEWFNSFWFECYEILELEPKYFCNREIEENSLVELNKIERRDKDYLVSRIHELTDEEIKSRFKMWLKKEPDNIYTDLNIESLKEYILIEYKDYNLIILESFESGNGYYYFNYYDVESLIQQIKLLSKTEIFNLSTMNKRGYHLRDERNFKIAVNSLFVKKYNTNK